MSDLFRTSPTLLKRLADLSDQEAWTTFIDLYAPLIAKYVGRRERNASEVEEIVQKVCVRVLAAIPSFNYDPKKGHFRSWLGKLTIQLAEEHRQQAGRRKTVELTDDVISPSSERDWEDEFKSYVFERAMLNVKREFSSETWMAFEKQWVEHSNPKVLAEQMNRSISWLYQAKSNVLARLRSEVERLSDDTELFGPPK